MHQIVPAESHCLPTGMVVPDAMVPLRAQSFAVKPSRHGGIRRPQQVLRRASVLAAARRCMADHGFGKVTIRMVASDCDTTAQTVFNLVGNRTQRMNQAITDHGRALAEAARAWTPYPCMLLALAGGRCFGKGRAPAAPTRIPAIRTPFLPQPRTRPVPTGPA